MSQPTIACIVGSLREKSLSRAFSLSLMDLLADDAIFQQLRIDNLPHFNGDLAPVGEIEAFKTAIADAHGVLIVTPEYNYSVPGVLKNAIDWASRPAYSSVFAGRPVFIVSVTGGVLGGVRAQAHLKYIMSGMLAAVFAGREVVVTHASSKLTDGIFTDADTLNFAAGEMRRFIASLPVGDDRAIAERLVFSAAASAANHEGERN